MTTKTITITALIAAVLIALPVHTPAFAQNATPTASTKSASTSSSSAQLEELKVRLATKVAELRTVVKRAMYGTVKTVSVSSATVETKTKDIKIELTDDVTVTQMISGKRTTLPIENLEAKDAVTVFGTYDETLDLLKAQYIFIENASNVVRMTGIIADVDTEEFAITFNTKEGRSIVADIEKGTKTVSWSAGTGLTKSGFSKLSVGDTVHITGTPVAKKENHYSAVRVLDLGNITGASGAPKTTDTPPASPSATVKPTAKPTAKPTVTP